MDENLVPLLHMLCNLHKMGNMLMNVKLVSCLISDSIIINTIIIKPGELLILIVINSLTPICLLAGTKNYPSVGFLRRNSMFFYRFGSTTTTHKQHHHGELPPPPAARFLKLDPIQRKHVADEGGEGSVEAIQLNR